MHVTKIRSAERAVGCIGWDFLSALLAVHSLPRDHTTDYTCGGLPGRSALPARLCITSCKWTKGNSG